jgi:hypothetical protein
VTLRTSRESILTRQFLKGAVLLVRREAFDEVSGFDDDFFLFAEDIDLCQRIRSAGWTIEYVPQASFVHVGASSTERGWATAYREQLRGHLRPIAKHDGSGRAEFAKRFLVVVLWGPSDPHKRPPESRNATPPKPGHCAVPVKPGMAHSSAPTTSWSAKVCLFLLESGHRLSSVPTPATS